MIVPTLSLTNGINLNCLIVTYMTQLLIGYIFEHKIDILGQIKMYRYICQYNN